MRGFLVLLAMFSCGGDDDRDASDAARFDAHCKRLASTSARVRAAWNNDNAELAGELVRAMNFAGCVDAALIDRSDDCWVFAQDCYPAVLSQIEQIASQGSNLSVASKAAEMRQYCARAVLAAADVVRLDALSAPIQRSVAARFAGADLESCGIEGAARELEACWMAQDPVCLARLARTVSANK